MNDYTDACRSSWRTGSAMKRDEQSRVMWRIKQPLRGVKAPVPCIVQFVYYEKDRRRDLDNIAGFAHKVIFDSLKELGVIHDDSQKYVIGITDQVLVDKDRPRIEVRIGGINGEND